MNGSEERTKRAEKAVRDVVYSVLKVRKPINDLPLTQLLFLESYLVLMKTPLKIMRIHSYEEILNAVNNYGRRWKTRVDVVDYMSGEEIAYLDCLVEKNQRD
jgi:hypothetical protein